MMGRKNKKKLVMATKLDRSLDPDFDQSLSNLIDMMRQLFTLVTGQSSPQEWSFVKNRRHQNDANFYGTVWGTELLIRCMYSIECCIRGIEHIAAAVFQTGRQSRSHSLPSLKDVVESVKDFEYWIHVLHAENSELRYYLRCEQRTAAWYYGKNKELQRQFYNLQHKKWPSRSDDVDSVQARTKKFEAILGDIKEQLAHTKTELETIKVENEMLIRRKQERAKEIQNLKEELSQRGEDLQKYKDKSDEDYKRMKHLEAHLGYISQQLAHTKSKLETVKEEKETLIRRLSQYASAQLTQDNPDVADLSDLNRPTKLAEKFLELYDNEWTDGFEILTETYNLDEKDSVKKLLNILYEAYKFCLEAANKQDVSLKMAFICPGTDSTDPAKAIPQALDPVQLRNIFDLRKQTSEVSLKYVQQNFIQYLQQSDSSPERMTNLSPYVNRCVELCWHMVLRSPVVYIDMSATVGENFDKDKYRFYQTSGTKYRFVVWPALYLHANGPLLAKGIAEA